MNHNSAHRLRHYTPHLALIGANLLWALDYPLYHLLLPDHLHATALLAMALLATALFALMPLAKGRPERVERRDIPVLIGAALLIGIIHKGLLMAGLSRTSPIDGSIINTAGPLIVLTLSVIIGIDRLTRWKVVGLGLGLAGAVAVILWGGSGAHEKSDMIGNLMVTCGVTATALYTVWLKNTLAKYRVTTVMMWVYGIAALIMLPFGIDSLIQHGWGPWERRSILALVVVLLFLTYLPNLLFNYALKWVKPVETSIYSYLQPIAAIGVSLLMGLDKLHLDTLLFALIVFAGIALVIYAYTQERSTPHKKGAEPK